MRVLHVIDSLSGSGGAEGGLVREITRFSPDVAQCVTLLYDRTELSPRLEGAGIDIEVIGLPEGRGSRAWPRAVTATRRIARRFDPDVIQTSLFLGNLVGQLAGRSLRLPVVSNLVLSGDRASLRAFQPGAASRRADLLRKIAGVAARGRRVTFRALTEEVKMTNATLLGVDPDRVRVIPRGLAIPTLEAPTSRGELGLPPGPLVVNVGRHATQKGQTLLVESFAGALEEVPDAHLVIVGREGEATPDIEDTIHRLGLEDSVTLVGHSTRVADYLRHAGVFAFSSLMEGLGTAVLEAMTIGVPVVAFDIPPVNEATGGGTHARLVPVGDVAALARAMVEGLRAGDDGARQARDWSRQRYDIDRVAGEVEALLRSAVGY